MLRAGQSGRKVKIRWYPNPGLVRTRFWVIAILVNLGARLEPFGFAARTEADGIDIPSFCCKREGEQDFCCAFGLCALLSTQRDSLRGAR